MGRASPKAKVRGVNVQHFLNCKIAVADEFLRNKANLLLGDLRVGLSKHGNGAF